MNNPSINPKCPPSGTVTFLFTDIEGSTKLAQYSSEKWEALRQRHHSILRSAMDVFNGYVFQISGDLWGIARVSQFLGSLSLSLGDFEKAQQYLENQLRLDRKLDFRAGLAAVHDNIGDLYRAQGKFTQAEEHYQKAIQLAIDLGLSYGYSLYGLSMLALGQKDYQLAKKRFTELFQRTRDETEKMSACDFLMGMSAASAGLNQPERSAKLYGVVLAILDTIDYKFLGNDINEFERYIQLAREQLQERFELLVQEGRSMTLEQAIAFALENNHD